MTHPRMRCEAQPGVVVLMEAVIQALRCQPDIQQRIIVDEVLWSRRLSQADLLDALPGKRNALLRDRVLEGDPKAGSPLETIARVLLRPRGWKVVSQAYFEGIGRVDFLIEGRVVLELDGYEFHSSAEAFTADRQRTLALQERGMTVVRVSGRMLLEDVEGTMRRVADLVERVLGGA